MKNIYKFLAVAALIVSVIALFSNTVKLGGDTNFDSLDVTDGYKVDGTTVIDGDGNVDASITSDTGTFSSTLGVSGAGTFSSTVDIEGLTTISGATSTVKVGNDASGLAAGCIVLGDSGGATSTPVYITASGDTITATTTKPSVCQ